ncbi:hypothetical protein P171DRAFT_517365 [Karstenula rhodostoma CBS 690.94]|uniref:Uncharacterized protein n=1 Tax=Karstenula rhodostoma CBS 690.94 TaxID=1392251 RepID=A0A9P4PSQ2_9PLEO|nr:hypothetical protein P171DRAFT_517365 [Karstenula rhodostoma CBS 690.94]
MYSFRILTFAPLCGSVTALQYTLWDSEGCHGFNDLRRSVSTETDGCHVRGDVLVDLELEGRGGLKEQAISASTDGPNDAFEILVFFSTEDCFPENRIENAAMDEGCSSEMDVWDKAKEYKSWAVWNLCEGNSTCDF